jgi:transglutaminase-like putative cysteine protease
VNYDIAHALRLTFAAPVWEHHCELRLAPQANAHQIVRSLDIGVEPSSEVLQHRDGFGNPVHALSLIAPHDSLLVRVRASVETRLGNPFDFPIVAPQAERSWLDDALRAQPRLWSYLLHRSPATPELAQLDAGALRWPERDAQRPLLEALQGMLAWLEEHFEYVPGFTAVAPALEPAVKERRASCQDLAHLLISLARAWGAPARYVMGYHDPGYVEADEHTLHAWAEVLVPGAGWRGLDPSTHLVTNDTYVVVAVGRDAHDCPPIRSHFKGGDGVPLTTAELQVIGDQ